MKAFLIFYQSVLFTFLITSCGPSRIDKEVGKADLVGIYKSDQLFKGKPAELIITDELSLSLKNIPCHSIGVTYDYIDSFWDVSNVTPSGAWCIYTGGYHIEIQHDGADYSFVCPYDVSNNREVRFKKVK